MAVAVESPIALTRVVTDSMFDNTPRASMDLHKSKTLPEGPQPSALFLQQVHDAISQLPKGKQAPLAVRHKGLSVAVDSVLPTPGVATPMVQTQAPSVASSRRTSIELPQPQVQAKVEPAPPAVDLLRQINEFFSFHSKTRELVPETEASPAPPAVHLLRQINDLFSFKHSEKASTAEPLSATAPPAAFLLQQIHDALSFSSKKEMSGALEVESGPAPPAVHLLRQINGVFHKV